MLRLFAGAALRAGGLFYAGLLLAVAVLWGFAVFQACVLLSGFIHNRPI